MDLEVRQEICRRLNGHDYDQDGECRTCFAVFPLAQDNVEDLVTA